MKSWRHYLSFHSEIIFATQIIVVTLCVVIITSLIQLILKNDTCSLWLNLLASSMGYLLPSPCVSFEMDRVKQSTQVQQSRS